MTDAEGNEIGKLFVGGLSQATSSESLHLYFGKFGELDDAVVMMDNKTGRSRGFGYVKYTDSESVSHALTAKPHILDGKEVDAKRCNVNMKGRNRRSLKVFVGGIGLDQDVNSITAFFEQFGTVTDVNLMIDSNKQRHRGFAFVGFDEESVVKRLINMHFLPMNNKQVEIKAMEPPNYGKKGGFAHITSQPASGDNAGKLAPASYVPNNGMSLAWHPPYVHGSANHSKSQYISTSSDGCQIGPYGLAGYENQSGCVLGGGFLNPNEANTYFQPLIIEQQQIKPYGDTINGIAHYINGKASVPLILMNNSGNVQRAWQPSNSVYGVPFQNSQMGTSYIYHPLQPPYVHPVSNTQSTDDYWSTNSAFALYPSQQAAQGLIYAPGYVYTNIHGSNPQNVYPENPYILVGQSNSANSATDTTASQINSSQQSAFTTASRATKNGMIPSTANTAEQVGKVQQGIAQQSIMLPYQAGYMAAMDNNGGVYLPTVEHSSPAFNPNLWCASVPGFNPGIGLPYAHTIVPNWSIAPMNIQDNLNQIPASTNMSVDRNDKRSLTHEDIKVSPHVSLEATADENMSNGIGCILPMPSGDNADSFAKQHNTTTDEAQEKHNADAKSTEVHSVDKLDDVSTNKGNIKGGQSIPVWTARSRTPCWGDVRTGQQPLKMSAQSDILRKTDSIQDQWSVIFMNSEYNEDVQGSAEIDETQQFKGTTANGSSVNPSHTYPKQHKGDGKKKKSMVYSTRGVKEDPNEAFPPNYCQRTRSNRSNESTAWVSNSNPETSKNKVNPDVCEKASRSSIHDLGSKNLSAAAGDQHRSVMCKSQLFSYPQTRN